MKIGLVSPYVYPLPGGVTQHVRFLYENLRLRGHDVRILTSSHGLQRSSEGDVIRLGKGFSMPANGSVGTITLSPRYISQVRDVLERERFDVLHFHEPFVPFLSLVLLRESRSVNVGHVPRVRRLVAAYEFGSRTLGGYADRLHGRIAVSAAARHFIDRYFPGDYKVIPNGVDVERFRRAVPLARWQDGTPNILFVGRFEPRKGLLDLLKALPDPAQDRLRLPAAARRRRTAGARGAALRGDPPAAAAWSSSAASPTTRRPSSSGPRTSTCRRRPARESFGIVLLEAMAAGAPIVASDIHGYKGVVRRGREALLVPPHEPKQLAAAIAPPAGGPRAGRADVRRRPRPGRGVQLAARDRQGGRLLRLRDPPPRRDGQPAAALHGRGAAVAPPRDLRGAGSTGSGRPA